MILQQGISKKKNRRLEWVFRRQSFPMAPESANHSAIIRHKQALQKISPKIFPPGHLNNPGPVLFSKAEPSIYKIAAADQLRQVFTKRNSVTKCWWLRRWTHLSGRRTQSSVRFFSHESQHNGPVFLWANKGGGGSEWGGVVAPWTWVRIKAPGPDQKDRLS